MSLQSNLQALQQLFRLLYSKRIVCIQRRQLLCNLLHYHESKKNIYTWVGCHSDVSKKRDMISVSLRTEATQAVVSVKRWQHGRNREEKNNSQSTSEHQTACTAFNRQQTQVERRKTVPHGSYEEYRAKRAKRECGRLE